MNVTEMRNQASYGIDRKSTKEILSIINSEDKKVAIAVESAIDQITYTVDEIVARFNRGGRLFYIGAGTSGRLGVLDASECPPTYGVDHTLVQGIIAGGERALTYSIEGAEDDGEQGIADCKARGLSENDTLIGITANGGAPYVLSSLEYAKSIGCFVAAISCNAKTPVFEVCEENARIYLPVGPEIVAGSTRMKSGTAQKLTLNMITTTVMIKRGKVFNNLMVDVVPVNKKLVERSINMIMTVTDVDRLRAEEAFRLAESNTKTAIVIASLDVDADEAKELVSKYNSLGNLYSHRKPVHLAEEFR